LLTREPHGWSRRYRTKVIKVAKICAHFRYLTCPYWRGFVRFIAARQAKMTPVERDKEGQVRLEEGQFRLERVDDENGIEIPNARQPQGMKQKDNTEQATQSDPAPGALHSIEIELWGAK
jgi:hypothetical protein